MIPVTFLLKMGAYNLNINGVTVQATVVDNDELVNDGITELRSKLDPSFPLVGFDWKCTIKSVWRWKQLCPQLLVLYVKDRCLLVQLGRLNAFDSLFNFLSDDSICFLCLQDPQKFQEPQKFCFLKMPWKVSLYYSVLRTGVTIGTFAAKALNNRELNGCTNLVELENQAGFLVPKETSDQATASRCPDPDWGALCFTQEEVTYALEDAYGCYTMGMKLTSAF